jgi:hypothetical protein
MDANQTRGAELTERLELIESMIAEGRRSTTRWAMVDCAVGRGVLRSHRVVFRVVWRSPSGGSTTWRGR